MTKQNHHFVIANENVLHFRNEYDRMRLNSGSCTNYYFADMVFHGLGEPGDGFC